MNWTTEMRLLLLLLCSLGASSVYAGHPRCAGNPEQEKCEKFEEELARETKADKEKRSKSLEEGRAKAQSELRKVEPLNSGVVSFESYSFEKSGLGNILVANFAIVNGKSYDIKDIVIACDLIAPSGTKLRTLDATIFDVVKKNSKKKFQKFNVGMLHPQTEKIGCEVVVHK